MQLLKALFDRSANTNRSREEVCKRLNFEHLDKRYALNADPTGSVTISGTPTEGEQLTAGTSTLADADGIGTISYQWKRDGRPITGSTGWATQAGGSQKDSAYSVSVLGDGSSIVSGRFNDLATFGDTQLTSSGLSDAFVAKLDSYGNYLWVTQAGGSSYDEAYSVRVLDDGSAIFCGYFTEIAQFGSIQLTSSGGEDAFVAKLDSTGQILWATQAGGSGDEEVHEVAVLDDGSSIITGSFKGIATFGNQELVSVGEKDVFVAKLDANGNYVWATRGGGNSNDRGASVSVLDDGSVIVSGYFKGSAAFGNIQLISNGIIDTFVVKLNAVGDYLWATKAGGSPASIDDEVYEEAYSVAVLDDGSAIVTGAFEAEAMFGTTQLTNSGSVDAFIAKIDADGNYLWANKAGGNGVDHTRAVAVLDDGSSIVSGRFTGTAMFGTTELVSYGERDAFVAKFDASGNHVWATHGGGTDYEKAYAVAVLDDGSSIVSGQFYDLATFGDTQLTSNGRSDAYVAKIDKDGLTMDGSAYLLQQVDVGSTITVTVTYKDGGGTLESMTSAGTSAVAAVNDRPKSTPVRPQLEAVREVYIDDSLFGPAPIVFGKSELIGRDTKSFVITSVAAGSTVEKWDAAANQWRDVSTPPSSSNPRQLLQLLQNRIIQKDDQIRWIPRSTDGVTRTAFEIIGWDDGSEATEPEGVNVPGAVENLEIELVGDEVRVTWDPPTSGAAVTHYRIHQNATTIVPSTQTSHTFAKVASPASYAVTVHANSAEGAGEAMTVTLSTGSYVKNDGTVVDPILDTSGNVLDYDGPNLKADANLVNVNLKDAFLFDANLYEADLTGALLNGANLGGAILIGTYLNYAGLSGAYLIGATLTGADLTNAGLSGAYLSNVSSGGITGRPSSLPVGWQLSKGYLIGPKADLTDADLTGADLNGADLNGAKLSGANLGVATLTGADLSGVTGAAKYNSATILPAGFDPVAAGWTLVS